MGEKAELIDYLVKVFRTIASYASPAGGRILIKNKEKEGIKVLSSWSQRNLESGTTLKFRKLYLINKEFADSFGFTPSDSSSEQFISISKSEKYTAVVRSATPDEKKKKQFLEIWNENRLLKNIDVAAFDVHGDIYFDGEFGSLEWSPDENHILYIAEKKPPKTEPFYKPKPSSSKKEKTDEETVLRGGEYIHRPDWGEQLVGLHQPVVAVCNIEEEKLSVLEGIPENYSPGQVLWSTSGDSVYGVVLENEPRRLGLVYCTNRLSYIFRLSLTGNFKLLSGEGLSVRSPRLSPDGRYLVWLQRPYGGPHDGCEELVKYDLQTDEISTLVNIVRTVEKTANGRDFYGIYSQRLPKRCFSTDGTKLIFSTPQKFYTSTYILNIENATLSEVVDSNSLTVLDVNDDLMLCGSASLQGPTNIKICPIPSEDGPVQWLQVSQPEVAVNGTTSQNVELIAPNTSDSVRSYNSIYFGPEPTSADQKVPLIVFPHGGPHSVYVNQFMFDPSYFVSLGFGVLMVNYRGSLGAGQDNVDFLPGKVGDTDVKDVYHGAKEVLKLYPYLDPDKVVLYGGSHGGFLVTHLIGQYPNDYKAVSTRNPVIDVSAMFTISDIPDWCEVESGYTFDESKPLTNEMLEAMLKASPIRHVDNVVTPILLNIGKKDLRVPFSQGLYFYNALKARNVKTRLNVYDDNHPLGKVPNEMDTLINTALWFYEVLQLTVPSPS